MHIQFAREFTIKDVAKIMRFYGFVSDRPCNCWRKLLLFLIIECIEAD